MDQYSACYKCDVRKISTSALIYSFWLLFAILVLAGMFTWAVKPPIRPDVKKENSIQNSRFQHRKISLEVKLSAVAVEVGSLMPKVICTMKLLLGFTQVVAGSLQALDLDLTTDIRATLRLVNFNPMALFSSENRCSHEQTFSYFDELILYVVFPFALIIVYSCVGGTVYWLRVVHSPHSVNKAWKEESGLKVWNVYFKLILWTALVLFPALSTK